MKSQNTFETAAVTSAISNLRTAIAAVKDNEQALAKEKESARINIGSVSLEDLDQQEAIVLEEGKRKVRVEIRESSLGRLRAAVVESTKTLYVAFLELQADINDSVAKEKKSFHESFHRFLAPLMPHYGGPLDESILWRLSAPYERLLDSVQSLDRISREIERDPFQRAEFYERRSGMLLDMITRFESQGRKWFVAPQEN